MSSNEKNEVERLNQLLDTGDDDNRFPNILEPNYEDGAAGGVTREWSVRDLSRAYVRYRPELIRHGMRYLGDHGKSEEVVQDAFLYLLNAMPEIDSEEGLLKFLKWKVKLLSIDVLRAKNNSEMTVNYDLETPVYDQGFLEVERMEDAAVIRMALAKLSPRHREALVASIYEEKSVEELSEQLSLNSNATRQLLFRARASFRFALFGEADLSGKSISDLLSLASKRAAGELKNNAGKVSALVTILLSGGLILSQVYVGEEQIEIAGYPPIPLQTSEEPIAQDSATELNVELKIETQDSEIKSNEDVISGGLEEAVIRVETAQVSDELVPANKQPDVGSSSKPDPVNNLDLSVQLATSSANAAFYLGVAPPELAALFEYQPIEVFAGTGVSAFVDYNRNEKAINNVLLVFTTTDGTFLALPKAVNETTVVGEPNSVTVKFEGYELLDQEKNRLPSLSNVEAKGEVTLSLDTNGDLSSASMALEG